MGKSTAMKQAKPRAKKLHPDSTTPPAPTDKSQLDREAQERLKAVVVPLPGPCPCPCVGEPSGTLMGYCEDDGEHGIEKPNFVGVLVSHPNFIAPYWEDIDNLFPPELAAVVKANIEASAARRVAKRTPHAAPRE